MLAACAPASPPATVVEAGCERQVERTVAFTGPDVKDTVIARALGDTCESAVVVWVLRDAAGKVLWTHAAPYVSLAQAADTASVAEMGAFLDQWAAAPVDTTAASPAWGADAPPDAWGPTGHSMFARETYETIRAAALPRLCVPTSRETYQCLFYDATAEAVDVHFHGGA